MSRLDLIVFGATGYTGKFVVRELAFLMKSKSTLRWGVAGRSKEKLNQILKDISKEADIDLVNKVELIIVDIIDEESIRKMCEKGQIIINCVGPVNIISKHKFK